MSKAEDSKQTLRPESGRSVVNAKATAGPARSGIEEDLARWKEGRPLLAVAELICKFAEKYKLSSQETKVLLAFLPSGSNKTVSSAMGIGYTTVKLYWTRIFKKVGCIDQWAVMYLLWEMGIGA